MYKRILTIQDISCVGQCSLTVALPILSACGIETAILPSAILSTHTAGFSGFTCRDLTEDLPAINAHWCKEGITFDAIYTGYLGSTRQIGLVQDIFKDTAAPGCITLVDPAMADNGKLYPAFNNEYVQAMRGLCAQADFILPNITEAALLTGLPYRESYDRAYIGELLAALDAFGKSIILTGVSYAPGKTGVVVLHEGVYTYYEHEKLPNSCHGTGDIYASAFTGALIRGKSPVDAARIAADYTVACIKETAKHDNHWYGAAFEPVLGQLIEAVQ